MATRFLAKDFMTTHPHSVGVDQTLATAHEMMRKHGIRHLPVLNGGKVVGIVSSRDLHLIETLSDVDQTQVAVEEAMTPDPYVVSPDTPVRELAGVMAEHKYGAAVVMDGNKIVGLFTTVDAMRALTVALSNG